MCEGGRGGPNHEGSSRNPQGKQCVEKTYCRYTVKLGRPQNYPKPGGFAAQDLASRENGKVGVLCWLMREG